MKKFIGIACLIMASLMFISCNDAEKKSPLTTEVSMKYEENDFELPHDDMGKDDYPDFKETQKVTTEATTEEATKAAVTTTISYENAPEPDYKKAVYIDVPYLSQEEFPTGCELVSASMLLAHYGYNLEPDKIIGDGYLKTYNTYYRDGKRYGEDPHEYFIGGPQFENGFGCYSGAIVKALKEYLKNEPYVPYEIEDADLSEICENYIDEGEPVIIWASIDMKPFEPEDNSSWIIEGTEDEFTWLAKEHCLLLVGYDDYYYYLHDPLNESFAPYIRCDVEERYNEIGRQAVALSAK